MKRRLLLAGAGHAHLHVLKALARVPRPDLDVVVVTPYLRQVYSGMLPGWLAGHYAIEDCVADLAPLVGAAGARLVLGKVVALDATAAEVRLEAGESIRYDVLSLDVGADVDDASLRDTTAFLLPVRPIEQFIERWPQLLARAASAPLRLAVVGAGAAGVELALAMEFALHAPTGGGHEVLLVSGGGLLGGHGEAVVARVQNCLAQRGVRLVFGRARGCAGGLELEDGHHCAVDGVIAATGARPPAWLAGSGLALAPDGFVAVVDGQRSASHENVLAGGDVATRIDRPHPKSGVYAVRAGPVLSTNLFHALDGRARVSYTPQPRSLYLMATGPRHAIASWYGWSAEGAWVWRWKDWLDRRFMRRYR